MQSAQNDAVYSLDRLDDVLQQGLHFLLLRVLAVNSVLEEGLNRRQRLSQELGVLPLHLRSAHLPFQRKERRMGLTTPLRGFRSSCDTESMYRSYKLW